jgi:hypothetical protein
MAVPRTPLSLALVVVASFALAGCTSSSQSSGTAASSAAGDAAGGVAAAPAAGEDAAKSPRTASGAAPAAVVEQRVIRTAQVVVRVDRELAPAAAKVRALAQGVGGSVSSETTTFADAGDPGTTVDGSTPSSTGEDTSSSPAAPAAPAAPAVGKVAHPGQSLLVLRVPESSLDKVITLISGPGGVGKELSRAATSQDVTGDLADLQSRVATQRASVARIRALLGKAGSLRDVVLLESEVTKREADLEALEARQVALADRADLATLTVDLRTAEAAVTVATTEEPNAFLDGLNSGWKALTASLTVILTILGALLPLAIVAAILGLPVLWVLRRLRRTPPRPTPPSSTPTPSASAPTAGAGT